jgi:Carotenoid biosynthesis protein
MPEYPGMPYGPPPDLCYPLFEFSAYILFLFCFWHAWKKGAQSTAYLLGGVVFGLLLEYMEVMLGSYTYGRFTIMLGIEPKVIPLCIGVSWGIIMYTARLWSDALGLPLWAAAAFDTLLALNIDLSIDVVAYRLHMWHWDWSNTTLNPLTAQWFGIPYGNFFGWQTVVFCYAAFSRLLEKGIARRNTGILKSTSVALLALLCSLAVLYGTEMIFPALNKWGILSVHRFVGMCVLLILLVATGWKKRTIRIEAPPALSWIGPAVFHFLFTGGFFVLGFYTENKWMTVAAVINLLIGVGLHTWPPMLPSVYKQMRSVQ